MTPDRASLRATAEAATPGPWVYLFAGKNRFSTPVDIDVTEADWGGEGLREYKLSCSGDRNAWRAQDVEFIAAADPATVLALLDALDAAEAEVAEVRESLGGMVEWLAEVIVDTRDALRVGGCTEHVLTADEVGALEAATRILSRERNAHPSALDRVTRERDQAVRDLADLRERIAADVRSHVCVACGAAGQFTHIECRTAAALADRIARGGQ